MGCEHEFFDCDGFKTCKQCGFISELTLDPTNTTYMQHSHLAISIKNYTRKDRFCRLFHNLRGLQEIPIPVMEQIPPNLSLEGLKKFLKKRKHLRKYLNKLPSIWRQLGHKLEIITDQESTRARHMFNNISQKKSFLVVLPYVCKNIGRPDLLKYLKTPSVAMMKKYNLFL